MTMTHVTPDGAAAVRDYWTDLCERGRQAREALDGWRWILGDLACEVERRFGMESMADFAREVNIAKKTAEQYRRVARFYPEDTRVSFLQDAPNVTYTHFRDAMRLGSVDAAYAFLEEVALNNWTTDEALLRLAERLGHAPVEREDAAPMPRAEFVGFVGYTRGGLLVQSDTVPRDLIDGAKYRVVLYEES